MDLIELAKVVGGLSVSALLALATYTLWKEYKGMRDKVDAVLERYHTTLTAVSVALQQVADAMEKEEEKK